MNVKTIVLMARPEVRTMCPVEWIEGEWREVPAECPRIELMAPLGPLGENVVTLIAEPSGRMQRRKFDGHTAPIWEVRRA